MKFFIKIMIIIFIFMGHHLCSFQNKFSEFLYKISFHSENIKEHIANIILQNKLLNNLPKNSHANPTINEYFLTILNIDSLNQNTKKILDYSNFSILNLNNDNVNENFKNLLNEFDLLNSKKFLIMKNENELDNEIYLQTLNENLFRLFNYENFSFAYLKPKLLNNKDLLYLYKYLNILKSNSYTPIILIDKFNLNEDLIKNFSKEKAIFLILDEEFSIKTINNLPVIHIDLKNNSNLFFQINMLISNSSLKKFRFKILPINKKIFDENNLKYKFNSHLDDDNNVDYFYLDFDMEN